jgi:hypothetical protein
LFWLGFSRLAFSFLFSPPHCSAGSIFWLPQRLLSERELL